MGVFSFLCVCMRGRCINREGHSVMGGTVVAKSLAMKSIC